jgi:hypothetical protein
MPPRALVSQYRVGQQSRCPAILMATPQEPQGVRFVDPLLPDILTRAVAVVKPTIRRVAVPDNRAALVTPPLSAGRAVLPGTRSALARAVAVPPWLPVRPVDRPGASAQASPAPKAVMPQRAAAARAGPAATMLSLRSAVVARRARRWTAGLKVGAAGTAAVAVSPAEALAVARSREVGSEPRPIGLQMSRRRTSKRLHELAELLDERDLPGRVPLRRLARRGLQFAGAVHGAVEMVAGRQLAGNNTASGAACRASDRLSRRRFDRRPANVAVCPSIAKAARGCDEPDRDAVAGLRLRQRQIDRAVVDPAQAVRGGVARRIALVPDPFPRCLARFSQDHGRGRRGATACAVERHLAIGPSDADQAAPAPDRHAVEPELRRELATGSRRPGEHVRRNGAQLVERMDPGEHRAGGRGEAAPARTAAPALQRTTASPPSAEIRAAVTAAAGDLVRQHLDGTQRAAQQQFGADARPPPRQRSRERIGACCRFSHVTSLVGDGCLGPWQQNLNEGLPHERAAPRTARAYAFSRHGSVAADPRPSQGGLP